MFKKIRRYIGRFFLLLVPIVILFSAGNWAFSQYKIRQLSGDLIVQISETEAIIDSFSLQWTANDQLIITAENNPNKIVWATLPNEPFLLAAAGKETVTDARGSFFVEDQLTNRCDSQTVQTFSQTEEIATITGHLGCGSAGNIPYQISFAPSLQNQLQFHIEIDDPKFNRIFFTYASDSDEHFFGFGEQFSSFDMKGKRLPIFIMEQGVGRGAQPITAGADIQAKSGGKWHTSYAGVPHYISSKMRSLFLENYQYTVFDMRQDDRVQISVFSSDLTGRILIGDTPAELIENYTAYAGRMRPLPDWIISGAVVGMQGGSEKVEATYASLQQHDIPIAAFWLQDWEGQRITTFGKQLWWNWELDRDRYPTWDEMVAEFTANDIRVMVYVNPFLADVSEKENHKRNLYQEALQAGYLIKNPEGEPYLIQNTSFSAGLVDLTNPEAYNWLKEVIKTELAGVGAYGWMADFGEALPYDAQLFDGDPAIVHNQYPELWGKLNREAIEELPNSDQYVFFSRSGYRQSPTYTTLFWEGDQMVSWDEHDGIKTAVIGLLSSGISGYAFNHSDIGGYTTITNPLKNYHRSRELLWRWMELSAFTTVFRTHEGNIPDMNHQFYSDDETMAQFAQMARLYKSWEFYRKELVTEASNTGIPVVRPLFLHYPDDPETYQLSYQQFMVGSELIVAPVLDPETTTVSVYLPAGEWIHLWSGERYTGNQYLTISAPLGEPAVFYPHNSTVGPQIVTNLGR